MKWREEYGDSLALKKSVSFTPYRRLTTDGQDQLLTTASGMVIERVQTGTLGPTLVYRRSQAVQDQLCLMKAVKALEQLDSARLSDVESSSSGCSRTRNGVAQTT